MKKTVLFATSLAMAVSAFSFCTDAAAQGKPRSERGELVRQIVMKWGNHVQEAYRADVRNWTGAMAQTFANAKIDTLQRAANATNFDAMNDLLLADGNAPAAVKASAAAKKQITARSLGDAAADLVFVPITPCRLLDTRIAGGQIAAGTVRSFDVTAVSDYSFQGGNASNCGGAGAAGSFAAVAINFTIVSPVGGPGHMTVFPFGGTQPTASSLNFNSGDVRGNLGIFQLDQGPSANELSVFVTHTTHLVGDMVGYFINPQPTALQCVDTATTNTTIAAGATTNSIAPVCPAGYTQTATNCQSSTWQMPFVYFSGGTCSAQNNSASSATLRSSRTCCRVPGRL